MARPLKMICLGAFHSGASVDSELMLVLVDTYPLLMWVPNPFFLGFKDQKIDVIMVPVAWYPRLLHASQEERDGWRLIGKGNGIHWETVDEDINIEGLLAGRLEKTKLR